jgi:hypothetical protein
MLIAPPADELAACIEMGAKTANATLRTHPKHSNIPQINSHGRCCYQKTFHRYEGSRSLDNCR